MAFWISLFLCPVQTEKVVSRMPRALRESLDKLELDTYDDAAIAQAMQQDYVSVLTSRNHTSHLLAYAHSLFPSSSICAVAILC